MPKYIGSKAKAHGFFALDRTAAITLLLGIIVLLAVTIFSWNSTKTTTYERNLAAFKTLSTDSEQALIHRIESYRQSLDSGAALFATSDRVTIRDWQTFVGVLKIEETLPGKRNGMKFSRSPILNLFRRTKKRSALISVLRPTAVQLLIGQEILARQRSPSGYFWYRTKRNVPASSCCDRFIVRSVR